MSSYTVAESGSSCGKVPLNSAEPISDKHSAEANVRAAHLAGVSPASIKVAKQIAKEAEHDPHATEVYEQVRAGTTNLYAAEQELFRSTSEESEDEDVPPTRETIDSDEPEPTEEASPFAIGSLVHLLVGFHRNA